LCLPNIPLLVGRVRFTNFKYSYYSKYDGCTAGKVKVTDNVTNAANFISANKSICFTAVGNTVLQYRAVTV